MGPSRVARPAPGHASWASRAQPTEVVPLFETGEASPIAEAAPAPGKGYVMFPAGWLVVKDGPGKGASYALTQGVSQIGRGADQTVSLDYGDMAISRQNHAAIAYDAGDA